MSAGGALCECYKQGMLEARFTDKNKLGRLELVFDVMSFVQQLTRASGLAEFPTVPHSVEAALHEESAEARVITAAAPPHGIEFVNAAWSELCGYTLDEVRGLTLRVIQGPLTEAEAKARIGAAARARRSACATLTNYAKGDVAFRNFLRIYPLWHEGTVTHMLGVLEACTGSSAASSLDGSSGDQSLRGASDGSSGDSRLRAALDRSSSDRGSTPPDGRAPSSDESPPLGPLLPSPAGMPAPPPHGPAGAIPPIPKGVDLSGAMVRRPRRPERAAPRATVRPS